MTLKLTSLQRGSVSATLEREYTIQDDTLPFDPPKDELDEAVELVAETVEAAEVDGPLPGGFPKRVLPLFADYGRTLRDGEWIEHIPKDASRGARFDSIVRARLAVFTSKEYQDEVDIVGTVTMARVNKPRMAILLDDGHEVEAAFRPEDEEQITTALKEHAVAKLRVEGTGQFLPDGQLDRITSVHGVTLIPSGELSADSSARPIWEVFQKIASELPAELLDRLPADGATQHDHYLYGTPKRP